MLPLFLSVLSLENFPGAQTEGHKEKGRNFLPSLLRVKNLYLSKEVGYKTKLFGYITFF